MIKRFFLIEDSHQKSDSELEGIIQDIERSVNSVKNGRKFSIPWLAGILNSIKDSSSRQNSLLRRKGYGTLKTDDEELEAETTYRAYKILADNGLIDQISKYEFKEPPHNDSARRADLSNIRKLARQYKEKTLDVLERYKKVLSAAEYSAATDYVNGLPENLKKAFNTFNELDDVEMAYLKHVVKLRDIANEKKTNYTAYIKSKLMNGSEGISRLADLGLINDNGSINSKLINDITTLFDDNNILYKLKPIAKELYYLLKRLSSDKTYAENSFVKRVSGSTLSAAATDARKQLNNLESAALLNLSNGGRVTTTMMDKFRELGLLDQGNKFTELGTAVATLVRTKRDSIEGVGRDIELATGRSNKQLTPDENSPSMPDQDAVQSRRAIRVDDLKSRGQRFLDFRKAKQAGQK